MPDWAFITNHGMVLASIANYQGKMKTAREIGIEVGITERTAHKIITDLEREGYITKTKIGRQNTYRIHHDVPIKTADASVGELLMMLGWKRQKRRAKIGTAENVG